jgi:flagella basal body P-ring formation protein FlgA
MWRVKNIIFAALLTAVLLTSAAVAQTSICLREQASAGGVNILLGDVADVHALPDTGQQAISAIFLGLAPSGDAERVLARAQIKRALDRSGLDLGVVEITGANEVRVKAALRPLDPEQVARFIQDCLAAEYPGGLLKLNLLKVTVSGQVLVPAGGFMLVPVRAPSSSGPAELMTFDLYNGKRRFRRFQVRVEWDWEASVATAARNLPFGHQLSEGDFQWVRQKRQNIPAGLVLEPGALSGMRLRRPLQAGQIILREALAAPRLVEKGDVVQLALRSKGFNIVTTATAQQAGESGDRIKVIQTDSKKVFVGKVVGKNRVEIAL